MPQPVATVGDPLQRSTIDSAVRPFETRFEDLPHIRDTSTEVRPFAVSFEDLPRLHDPQPGVRPFEVQFEDLPRVRDAVPEVRPFEGHIQAPEGREIETGAAAFGHP
jgi:hypothetical protein